MKGSQHVRMIGQVGTKPSYQYNATGGKLSFRFVVNTLYKTADGKKSRSDWFNVSLYGRVAATAKEKIERSSNLILIGEMRNRENEDKERYDELVANEFHVIKD